jgi:aspartate/methionine/tyrosine aminotransferase
MNENLLKSYQNLSDPSCKILFINNSKNPRGYVYKKDELYLLVIYCKETSTILVIDESYSGFFISENFYSAGNLINEFKNVILFN